MSAWKVLITDGLDSNGIDVIKKSAEVDEQSGISAEDLLKVVGGYDALIVRGRTKVTPAVFDAGTKLKVVGRAGVGVDNIDLAAAKDHKVTVVNSPLATTIAVAELTLGLMLSAVREIARADATMKAGKWLKKEFEGAELSGKTLGVIGFGRIGAAVAKRAAAFDMKILGYDPLIQADEIAKRGGDPVSMDDLLKQSDMITMHLPLTADTRNMLNQQAFAMMKQGVYIICAARGGVIDEAALLDALNSGKVAGAALDVFATEPPGLTDLVSHPKVVETPHVGAQTVEAQARAANDIAEEILAALNDKPLRWKVV
ncbi:MAG: D-3-phosphoglycerate dehydrogenase [Chloroflexi bacterium]|nr:MAG: D-3-phosphoglycerate dehydrogenase [Chloroflexota bacterium]